jgi:pimeloyl-ACP methyl ester carboxylesterase
MNPKRILTDFRSFAFLVMVILSTSGILIAQDPTLELAERTVDVHGGRIAYRIGGDGPPLLFVHGFTMTGEQWDQFLDAMGARHTVIIPDLPAHGRSTDISGEFDFSPERLATIRAKTLLVWGDRDFAYPVEIALEMYRAIPNASLWVIPDQGHTPVWTWLGGSKEAEAIFPTVVLKFIADEDP